VDPESEQIREVYARYGLAVYHGQLVERQLAMLLATEFGPGPERITRSQFDDLLGGYFQETLGRLAQRLERLGCSQDVVGDVQACLKARNWLVHHYFWDRAAQFTKTGGRDKMIAELDRIRDDFDKLDERLTKMTLEWARAHGITERDFEESVQAVLREGADQ
jgi:hypothetical protein